VTVTFEKSAVPLTGFTAPSTVTLAEGTTIRGMLQRFGGIHDEELYVLPVVNGVSRHLDHVMRDGDRLSLFTLSAGG